MPPKRPIRIAGSSGAASDRRHAMATFAAYHPDDPIDVIIGDFLSEANMTARGASKYDATASAFSPVATPAASAAPPAYEPTFLESLWPALDDIARHGIKVAVNAGASDTELLYLEVRKMVRRRGLGLKVAWVSGDEVMEAVKRAVEEGRNEFVNICTGEKLRDWGFEAVYAQAYLGGLGIAEAFARGADIVVCGRVSDASPVIGAAAWWHGWGRERIKELANAFVAGHLVECSNYVCGGNFTRFKGLESKMWEDIGYPIAEIGEKGEVVIAKSVWGGGEVSVDTCSSQLLYEIQGPWYFNSDVTAILDEMWFEQLGPNRVAVRGVKGDLPPPTTKVGLTAKGGYQAEVHWFMTGLDIEQKAKMMEAQARHGLKPYETLFSKLEFTLNGSAAENATNQNAATVDFRILAQAAKESSLMPQYFFRPVVDPIMEGYPGATPHLDWRQALPKPIYEYYVALMPQTDVEHKVHLWTGDEISIPPPTKTKTYPSQQPDQPVTSETSSKDFGPTVQGPLGWIVHARSGDKGSDCNVGFWVRRQDEYDWVRAILSTEKVKELLADEYNGKKIDRFELKNMRAVHFLLHDHLDRGVSCSSSYDFLGKNVAEFLRSRWVELPKRFLDRGKL
ncbi:hypothetical protein C1H76_8098 [Elsinoe australis]|uniref:DUF1446-domain-containing protein n=1 Tax=Elsinoe australis TaxID=40998 RepID=A0A4U7ATD2_9PEZI|nr:hypothetical protein C1H76_8098 [Elsinoe australis]